MTNDEIARFFNDTQAYIQGNPDLRDPQVEGWFRLPADRHGTRQHFRNRSEHANLQIPVGCGKTGLMALLPFTKARVGQASTAQNRAMAANASSAIKSEVCDREPNK